jgi:dihydropyrimidinase
MTYDLIIRGGTVVTATDAMQGDVAIRTGRIVGAGESLTGGAWEIDATGLLVLPGGVDVHTHLEYEVGGMTSIDDFESGTGAAACGGITTICDYAWQTPGRTIGDAIAARRPRPRDRDAARVFEGRV